MLKRITLLAFLVFLVVILSMCAGEYSDRERYIENFSSRNGGKMVAKIGDEYTLKAERLHYLYTTLPSTVKNNYDRYGGKTRFLRDFIDQKTLVIQALKEDFASLNDVSVQIERSIDKTVFQQYIRYKAAEKITEEQMKTYYKNYPEKFNQPAKVRARHILVTPKEESRIYNREKDDAKTQQEARKKINRLKNKLDSGKNFAELAEKYSEDSSARKGGDLGFFTRNEMAQPFSSTAFALREGEISDTVKTKFGFHLIKVLEKQDPVSLTYTEAVPKIREKLLPLNEPSKRKSFTEETVKKAKENYNIEINTENISEY